jgi:fibronectin type 3 domain-containing protein
MAISTITTNNITLTAGSSIPGTIRYNPTNNTAAFTPSSTLAYDTQYVLQVISCVSTTCIRDTAGNQLASNHTHTFTTESAPSVAPAAPSSVTATPGNAQVTLDWLASNGSTSYNVYYSLTSGMTTSTPIPDVQPPYVHLGRTNGQAYYYVVTAVNGFGESSPSTEISATPVVPTPLPNFPSPPASLTVGVGGGGTYNTMDWPAVSDAISYNLYWSTSAIIPNKYSADNVVRGVTSPYTHTGRSPGETYCYIVTAINSSGESADSMQSCVGIGSIQLYW